MRRPAAKVDKEPAKADEQEETTLAKKADEACNDDKLIRGEFSNAGGAVDEMRKR